MSNNMDAALPMPLPSGMPSFTDDSSTLDADPPTQSEARFRALAQATGQIYWIADAQGHPIDSSSWCAFTGQTADEASGDGWTAALHPDDREPTLADWKAAVDAGHPYRHEHRARRADGQYRLMLVQAYPVLDADGAVREWVGVATDITLLGELRTDVQASQEEFRATFEQAAVGIAHINLDNGRFLRANQKLCEILDYTYEELLCHTFQELTSPQDLDTNLTLLEQLLAGDISTYTLEKRYIRKDGGLVWANLTTSLKRDQTGIPEYGIAVVEDISARKAAEEALSQSEQHYHQLFELMAQGVISYSASGDMLSANPAALHILGLTQEEIQMRSALDLRWQTICEDGSPLPPEDRPFSRALRTSQPISDVLGVFHGKEQVYRWLQMTAIPEFRPGESAPYRIFATFEDITERRRLEEELRARVQELETIFASISEGLFVMGADGQILRTNPAYEALTGWPAGSALYAMTEQERLSVLSIRNGQGQVIPPDQFVPFRLLRGEHVAEEQIFRRPDGREMYVQLRGAPLTDAAGRVTGGVVVFHDLTERRQLEQQTQAALQALLRMAEVLVQHPPESEKQPSPLVGRHLAELACSLLGCPVATIITLDPQTLRMQALATVGYPPAQKEQAHSVISSWPHSTMELAHLARLRAGETLVLDVTEPPYQEQAALFEDHQVIAAPMRLGGQMMGMVIFHPSQLAQTFTDQQIALAGATAQLVGLVVERERLLRERTEARANELAVRRTQTEMESFLGIAGHELKNPLTSIKLALQLLERRLRRFAQQETDLAHPLAPFLEEVARARHQAARLERLVNELLDISRVRAGKLELHPEPTDLAVIVRQTVDEQREIHPERTLLLQFPPRLAVPVVADADRLGQVVTNYLTNALKYSLSDRPVEVGLDIEEQQAQVWVRDQGPGIPPEEQERIWDRFHRVTGIQVQSGTGVGLGLGLHICRTIIERHQGQVGVQSAPGQGSTFWFTVPLGGELEEGGPAPE